MAQFIWLRLMTPLFSCNLWLPYHEHDTASAAIDRMVKDILIAIQQAFPEIVDEIEISDVMLWP